VKRIIVLCTLLAITSPAFAEEEHPARDLSRDEIRPHQKKIAESRHKIHEISKKLWAPNVSWKDRIEWERALREETATLRAALAEIPKSAEHGHPGEWGAVNGPPGE
jgi:hypothetical protein